MLNEPLLPTPPAAPAAIARAGDVRGAMNSRRQGMREEREDRVGDALREENRVGNDVERPHAVWIRDLTRRYGGRHSTLVLDRVNLTVPRGVIYGLLGPSGCGKTMLLKSILGLLRPTSGTIRVFGTVPGRAHSNVPGAGVGFMPQELALYGDFSVQENCYFYGKVHGMTTEAIAAREHELLNLLHIPVTSSRKSSLYSGGQQRRLSLALAMLHSPPLLLLDEPTVGVDPLLRQKIWQYLVDLARQGVSIVITTHYIEEARQADVVGFMRHGQILEEGWPDELLRKHAATTLEQVFLQLCNAQDDASSLSSANVNGFENGAFTAVNVSNSDDEDDDVVASNDRTTVVVTNGGHHHHHHNKSISVTSTTLNNHDDATRDDDRAAALSSSTPWLPRWQQTWACTWRTARRLLNNIPAMLFVFLLPSIQLILFCLAIGSKPSNLPFGIVNLDAPATSPTSSSSPSLPPMHLTIACATCALTLAQAFAQNTTLSIHTFASEDEALRATLVNDVWGYLVIPRNFTFAPTNAATYRLDLSNEQISVFVEQSIRDAYEAALAAFEHVPANELLPVQQGAPVYGSASYSYTDFVAPGIMVTIAFSLSIGLTALGFVGDKKNGCLDRGWASGLRSSEAMLSQTLITIVVLTVQVSLLFIFGIGLFRLPMNGSIMLIWFDCTLLGLAGALYGLVIGAVCEEEHQAVQLAMGSFFPALLLSGVIWPVEAIPVPLSYVSLALPTTWASIAGRDIMTRGWSVDHPSVGIGIAVVAAWCAMFFIVASRAMTTRK